MKADRSELLADSAQSEPRTDPDAAGLRRAARRLRSTDPSRALLLSGVGIAGVSGFIFLGIASRVLGPSGVLPVDVLWVTSNIAGPTLFIPFEQLVARSIAERRSRGERYGSVLLQTVLLLAVSLTVLGGTCALALGPLTHRFFPRHPGYVLVMLAIVGAFGLQHLTRGFFAAQEQLGRYGVQLIIDGLFRVGGATVAAICAAHTPAAFAAVLIVGPCVSVLVTSVRVQRPAGMGARESWKGLSGGLAALIATQALSTCIVSAGPVLAQWFVGPGQSAAASELISVFLFARFPLLGLYAVQASLIPYLAKIASAGKKREFKRHIFLIEICILLCGVIAVAGSLTIGDQAMHVVFGPDFSPPTWLLACAVASVVLFIGTNIMAQSLMVIRKYGKLSLTWAGGAAAYAIALVPEMPPEKRICVAFLVSTVVSALLAALLLRRALGGISLGLHWQGGEPS